MDLGGGPQARPHGAVEETGPAIGGLGAMLDARVSRTAVEVC